VPVTATNILIIKPGAMGDLVQMTPVFRALHRKLPDARITILVGNRASADIFTYNPIVKAIVFDRKGEHRSWSALFSLWRRLRGERYDLVLNYQRSNMKAWFLATAAFPCRVLVYRKPKGRSVHAVINHLETLAPLGIAPGNPRLEFYPGPEAEQHAAEYFKANGLDGKTVIALNPGASHPVNRWSTTAFAALTDLLADKLGARTLLIGGADDVGLAEEVVAQSSSLPLVLTGQTDPLQLGAVLQRCAILVTGDTGPMHIATAVGTRVVALFGAADPDRTGPVGMGHRVIQAEDVACVPCRSRTCTSSTYLECMDKIAPAKVFDTIVEMLQEAHRACESGRQFS